MVKRVVVICSDYCPSSKLNLSWMTGICSLGHVFRMKKVTSYLVDNKLLEFLWWKRNYYCWVTPYYSTCAVFVGTYLQWDAYKSTKMPAHPYQDPLLAEPGNCYHFFPARMNIPEAIFWELLVWKFYTSSCQTWEVAFKRSEMEYLGCSIVFSPPTWPLRWVRCVSLKLLRLSFPECQVRAAGWSVFTAAVCT